MPVVLFYFDYLSPYAYLAFHRLPVVLDGLAYQVEYRPLVLGALLKTHGTPPPVALPPKREWIRRHAGWLARQWGIPLAFPPEHPFAPLPWLRMTLAASPHGLPGRQVVETLFNAVWQGGHSADDVARQQQLWAELQRLQVRTRQPDDAAVKAELFANGAQALEQGVFGVPACVLLPESADQPTQVFWGVEGLPMLREAVQARQLQSTSGTEP